MIDATGKWVTPGIVSGFSRLGLAEVDLGAPGSDDTEFGGSPFSAAIDVAPAVNPLASTIAVNRADGVTRALVAPTTGRSIFAGQGAVIDTGADMDPITAPAKIPVRRARRVRSRDRRRLACFGACPVPQRAARGGGVAAVCAADFRRAPAAAGCT